MNIKSFDKSLYDEAKNIIFMESNIILPRINPDEEVELYKKLNKESLEKLWRDLENENLVIFEFLNGLAHTLETFKNFVNLVADPDFQSITPIHIDGSNILRYSGSLTYSLLKKEQKKLDKNLPLVSKETSEAFDREGKKYHISLEKKIQQDDVLISLPTMVSQELIEKFWEEKWKTNTLAREVGKYGVIVVYGLLYRQIESDELKELFS